MSTDVVILLETESDVLVEATDDEDVVILSDSVPVVLAESALATVSKRVTDGTLTLDFNDGHYAVVNLASNVDSFSVTHWPPDGYTGRFLVQFRNEGDFQVNSWPANSWAVDAVVPGVTLGANSADLIALTTGDSGNSVFISVIGNDFLRIN